MFEIPDDDDSFWEELPLDAVDRTDSFTSKTTHVDDSRSNDLKDPFENPGRQFCRGLPEPVKGVKNELGREGYPPPANSAASATLPVEDESQLSKPLQGSTPSFGHKFHSFTKNQFLSNPLRSTDESLHHEETPELPYRSRRKFPGPAGILPKLAPGQSMDGVAIVGIGSPNSTATSLKEDTVIVSSQNSEDIFSDLPWQTLLKDLGDDGKQLLSKFAICVILDKSPDLVDCLNLGKTEPYIYCRDKRSKVKARRKQLSRGKVTLMFAVIESMDTLALDASVTLKDKSGKMQGTVHRDVLKEYELEFQTGSVLVLRQVSVLSLTSRNHYLNITPSNIVIIYQKKNTGLAKVWCLKEACSLSEMLLSLDRQAYEEEEQEIKEKEKWESLTGNNVNSINAEGTPLMTTPGQNRNLSVRTHGSVTGAQNRTPQLFSGVQGMNTPNMPRVSASGRNSSFNNVTNMQRASMHFSNNRPQIPRVRSPFHSNVAHNVRPPHIGSTQMQNLTQSASTLSVLRNEQSFLSGNQTSNRTAGSTFVQNRPINEQNHIEQGSSKSSNSASTTSVPGFLNSCTLKISSGKDSLSGNPWRFKSGTSPSGTPEQGLSTSFSSNSDAVFQSAKPQQGGQQNLDISKDMNTHNLENTGSDNLIKTSVVNTRSCQLLGNLNVENSGLNQQNSAVQSTANRTALSEVQRINERNMNLSRQNSEEHLADKLQSKWSFKPRSSLSSPSIGVTTNCHLRDENMTVQQKTEPQSWSKSSEITVKQVKRKAEEDNLWQDDLSDDLLSQLSDDFL